MENLDIAKFSLTKASLAELANRYTSLTINGIDDTVGYAIVDEARKDLKKKRILIKNTGKELRQEAIDFQKRVIAMEKELIEIIEPLELELKAKQDVVDAAKRKALRMAALPARKEKLAKINLEMADDDILAMSAEEFVEFYNVKYGEFLEAKERAIKEQEEKIAREKELEVARERAKIAAEEAAREEAARIAKETAEREARLKEEAEAAKVKAVREAEEKAAAEKQALIDEQNAKEAARLKAEEDAKLAEQERLARERLELEELEKKKKYQKFLSDNGYNEDTKHDFHILRGVDEVILYKKVDSFIF